MRVIPFRDDPFWEQEIDLEGTVYRFDFTWNTLFKHWTMAVKRRDNSYIIAGVKLVISYDILSHYKYDDLPKGSLVTVDSTEDLPRIERYDMGSRIFLVYFNQEELNTQKALLGVG